MKSKDENKKINESLKEIDSKIKRSSQNWYCCDNKIFSILVFILVLIGGILIGRSSVNNSILPLNMMGGNKTNINANGNILEYNGKTWIAYDVPVIDFTILNDKNCELCDTTQMVTLLKSSIPTLRENTIDINSPEGSELQKKLSIKSLPAVVFDTSLEKTTNFAQISKAFDKNGDSYVLNLSRINAKPGKYLELPKVAGSESVQGLEMAPIVIVEYSDFQCPYCARAEETIKQVLAAYPDKIKLVYKQFPLSFHDKARKASEASLCAREQGKFWQMHDLLFENQQKLEIKDLKGYAKQLNLNTAKFATCLDNDKYDAEIEADITEATSFGISGTPAFFINDEFLGGAYPFEDFKKVIDKELNIKQ